MAAISYTLTSARKSSLTDVERINGFNAKFSIPYSDIGGSSSTATAATDVVTVVLGATPALWMVDAAFANITSAFTVTGTQTISMSIGTTTSVAAIMTAQSLITAASLTAANGKNTVETIANCKGTATINLAATITNAAAGSLSLLTTGNVDIYLNITNCASGCYG